VIIIKRVLFYLVLCLSGWISGLRCEHSDTVLAEYVYHGSSIHNLKQLKPSTSTHGVSWVYATPLLPVAASFMVEASDFDLAFTLDDKGKFCIVERYKKAFDLYKDHSGSIYTLSSTGFISHQTSWELEVINPKEVAVIEELRVDDIIEFLKRLEQEGQVKLYYYPDRPSQIPTNDSDLIEKALLWTKANTPGVEGQFFRLHPHLKDRYETAKRNDSK
jgi:hypothetical protein